MARRSYKKKADSELDGCYAIIMFGVVGFVLGVVVCTFELLKGVFGQ